MKTVLLVYDSQDVIKFCKDLITHFGLNPVAFRDRLDALEYIKTNKPNLVLLDLWYHNFNDIKFFSEVRTRYPDVPVWLFYNVWDDPITKEVERLKPNDYINFDLPEKLKKFSS
jgi:DNA-binding NtrC family response regulator